jgi:succinate-semialdehyde dehydrogenase/glutarate-semialdehyde dehydrogenase
MMGGFKYRNAGQVCISPTRFFVHEKVYDDFVGKFIDIAKKTKVGDGMAADSRMGPLANPRRVNAIEAFVTDAQEKGAKVEAGGKRIGNQGNFFEPTVLTEVPDDARIMNEEPFGPVAVMLRFKETDEMLERANKLPYGLASYAFTKDAKTAGKVADALESGMVTINHMGLACPKRHSAASRTRASATRAARRACRSTCRRSSSVIWGDGRLTHEESWGQAGKACPSR